MNNITKKAQVQKTTIWIILLIVALGLGMFLFLSRLDLFKTLLGVE